VYSPPTFFIPTVTTVGQEQAYSTLAKICGCDPPAPGKRISSITFDHDGVRWTAIVGEKLRGERKKVSRSKGKKIETTVPVSDPSTVIAIFPGAPFQVFLDKKVSAYGVHWANPFFATPNDVGYFSPE
jgi:hypothetical protein